MIAWFFLNSFTYFYRIARGIKRLIANEKVQIFYAFIQSTTRLVSYFSRFSYSYRRRNYELWLLICRKSQLGIPTIKELNNKRGKNVLKQIEMNDSNTDRECIIITLFPRL